MFFILSKLITLLVMPTSLIIVLFLLSFFIKKRSKLFRGLAIALLFFFTNPFFIGQAISWWEVPPIEIKKLNKQYEAAVVLCGITNPRQKPDDRVHFNNGADRIVHAIQLYKAGIVKKILISGGSGYLMSPEVSESQDLYEFSVMAGVKKKDIILENESRNTHENALYSRMKLDETKIKEPVLLITSAFHMRRAQACFQKENIYFDVFSTDLITMEFSLSPDQLIVPNVYAMAGWTMLFKEWLGMIAYKVMGYI